MREFVDAAGVVRASYEFSEYGQRIATSESGASSQKTFVGGRSVQDEVGDTGLMMMGHRFYDPSLGRFLNRDPIGFRGGMNLFEYSKSSPILNTDSRGLERDPWIEAKIGIRYEHEDNSPAEIADLLAIPALGIVGGGAVGPWLEYFGTLGLRGTALWIFGWSTSNPDKANAVIEVFTGATTGYTGPGSIRIQACGGKEMYQIMKDVMRKTDPKLRQQAATELFEQINTTYVGHKGWRASPVDVVGGAKAWQGPGYNVVIDEFGAYFDGRINQFDQADNVITGWSRANQLE